MTDELLPGSTVPTKALTGAEAARYVDRLRKALRAARLNSFYPDSRRLASQIAAMSPEVHRGLYDDLQVDRRSGLPAYRDWTRVQTDVTIAEEQLAQLGRRDELERKSAAKPESIWAKQLLKHAYYSEIAKTQLATLGDMEVALRRIDRSAGRAEFHVVLDKLDVSGLFVRYTIDMAENLGPDAAVSVDGRDVARHSEHFRGSVYRFTSLDAEFTFVKLASLHGLEPERVSKGVVGPIWDEVTGCPEPLRGIVDGGGFVATFGFDIAAVDVSEQRNNDPFATLASERLTAQELKSYDAARRQFGYRVFKDRKFVVRRQDVDAMRKVCESLGTKNIIYGI